MINVIEFPELHCNTYSLYHVSLKKNLIYEDVEKIKKKKCSVAAIMMMVLLYRVQLE